MKSDYLAIVSPKVLILILLLHLVPPLLFLSKLEEKKNNLVSLKQIVLSPLLPRVTMCANRDARHHCVVCCVQRKRWTFTVFMADLGHA